MAIPKVFFSFDHASFTEVCSSENSGRPDDADATTRSPSRVKACSSSRRAAEASSLIVSSSPNGVTAIRRAGSATYSIEALPRCDAKPRLPLFQPLPCCCFRRSWWEVRRNLLCSWRGGSFLFSETRPSNQILFCECACVGDSSQ